MRYLLPFLIFFSFVGRCQLAQQLSSHPVSADRFVGYDKFGFAYFITNNALSKTNGEGSVEYQNVALGKLLSVDLQNPLRIVLLYADFNTVVMLDNQLNEIGKISFSERNDPIVIVATGNASQNRLWFFDTLSHRIGLYDYLLNSYQFLTQPLSGQIGYSESDFNTFQWLDADGTRFAIDVYGKVRTIGKIPLNDGVKFADDSAALYRKDDSIYYHDGLSNDVKLIETDSKSFRSFWYKDQILAIFTNHTITNFKITLP